MKALSVLGTLLYRAAVVGLLTLIFVELGVTNSYLLSIGQIMFKIIAAAGPGAPTT
jgi:hypothetical protein